MRDIDTEWFQEQARIKFGKVHPDGRREGGQNELARRMGLDPSALVHAFHGRRKISLAEVEQLSLLLKVPLLEVLRRAGVEIDKLKRRGLV